MLNFFKRLWVRFLTRKVLLVSNRTTDEHFIVSNISYEGYIVLMTGFGGFIHISYSIYKRLFQPVTTIQGSTIIHIQDDNIQLSSGETLQLADINEPVFEEGIDTSF
jgi:hypothetical protein